MSDGIPKETLAKINEVLSEQMGLSFPENRLRDLERGLLVACRELGLSGPDQCLSALQGSSLSRQQVELLASHLTVGETYFFRDPKSFRVLEENILPELIERRRHTTRILRFWSAGSSSGEEAYSIAILLQRLLPDWREWGLVILGTDINPGALRKAEIGVYSEWSFRGLGPEFKKSYFTREGKKRYRLNEDVRRMVRFSYLNLAQGASYPSLATNTLAMDVIFCRNVLMYFSRETIQSVTRRFHQSLTDGGWVFSSPSEASPQFFPDFETVNFPGAVFFRKPVPALPVPEKEEPPTVSKKRQDRRKDSVESRPWTSRRPAVPAPRDSSEAARERDPAQLLREGDNRAVIAQLSGRRLGLDELEILARARASAGSLPEALACCEAALSADPLAARFHYLKAGVLQEMGESDSAAAALRKALFLEKNFAMAHFTLGNLYRQRGNPVEARRHFRRAGELFSKMPPDRTPPESEGINAGRLREMAAANLHSLNA